MFTSKDGVVKLPRYYVQAFGQNNDGDARVLDWRDNLSLNAISAITSSLDWRDNELFLVWSMQFDSEGMQQYWGYEEWSLADVEAFVG
jgi:hypothetical protein